MRISLNWLSRYVELKDRPEVLADRLTSVGLEVESIEHLGTPFNRFVVGEVLSVSKHPNADKLSVCRVNVSRKYAPESDGVLQIVCGAPNVQEKQKVAVGLAGAVVPHNQHDPDGKPFTLSVVKVRGEESHGMICSEYELGLGNDSNGILVLDPSAKVGTPLAKQFGLDDTVFEIGVTPNRADCLSHLGIAREVAAILGNKVKFPVTKVTEDSKSDIRKNISIHVENLQACPRYTARLITGVKVAPSPAWLQSILKACGIRPINNVVDVTNFVMYECGQPLHAFDYSRIQGAKIIVKNAKEGEKFITLDGSQHSLSSTTLMICDAERPIAIAGVMGGLNSEIDSSTTSVLIESAYFEQSGIRKSAKQFGISSDASYRFERGTDPNGTLFAAQRAAMLLNELAGGVVEKGIVDVYPKKIKGRKIRVRISRANEVLGTEISLTQAKRHLNSIGITVQSSKGDSLVCVAPTFRPDLEHEIDLVEELARLHGYSNIEDKMVSTIDFSNRESTGSKLNEVRRSLEGLGFNEVVTNSLIDDSLVTPFSENVIRIKNPISAELSAMRPSTIYSMLQTVYYNANYGTKDIKFYEIGRTYGKSQGADAKTLIPGIREQEVLSLCMSGRRSPLSWYEAEEMVDIHDLKGAVESLLGKILLDKFQFICYDSRSALTEQTIAVETNGTYIGFLGKVKAELLRKFSVESDVYVSELSVEELVHGKKDYRNYVPSSKFPSVRRDLAFVVEKSILSEALENRITLSAGPLLSKVVLFDVFEGKPLPPEKKSFAFALELNSSEKTLTEKEASNVIEVVVKDVCREFNAELRSA